MVQKKNSFGRVISQYSFIIVFIAIFAVYALVSNGLTWNGVMNILRHSAVIGIIGMAVLAVAYPLYNRTLKKERERIAPEILRLTDELMK